MASASMDTRPADQTGVCYATHMDVAATNGSEDESDLIYSTKYTLKFVHKKKENKGVPRTPRRSRGQRRSTQQQAVAAEQQRCDESGPYHPTQRRRRGLDWVGRVETERGRCLTAAGPLRARRYDSPVQENACRHSRPLPNFQCALTDRCSDMGSGSSPCRKSNPLPSPCSRLLPPLVQRSIDVVVRGI